MTAPFTDARMPEAVARVAYQLVRLEYRKRPNSHRSGADIIIDVIERLECMRGSLPHSALLAMLFAQRQSCPTGRWLSSACANSRMGYGFRRCWYEGYKANRRDPRVTNRGVR